MKEMLQLIALAFVISLKKYSFLLYTVTPRGCEFMQ